MLVPRRCQKIGDVRFVEASISKSEFDPAWPVICTKPLVVKPTEVIWGGSDENETIKSSTARPWSWTTSLRSRQRKKTFCHGARVNPGMSTPEKLCRVAGAFPAAG